jgi:hypothetical protein
MVETWSRIYFYICRVKQSDSVMKIGSAFFLFLIFTRTGILFSQSLQQNSIINSVNVLKARDGKRELIYSTISGSPYYSDDFVKSTVSLTDSSEISVSLRYDLFQDEMEFTQKNNTLWLDKKSVGLIKYGDEKIVVMPLQEQNLKPAYFFLLNNGNFKLLIRKEVKYYPPVPPKGYSDPTPERFVRERDEIYLKFKDQPPQYFKSKKELINILGNKTEISNFITKEKIRIDNISSLLKLIEFLNKSNY